MRNDVDCPIINTLSLCSGVGMLDLGLHAAIEHLGGRARAVAYCERDAYASAVLLSRMEDASLGAAPVWSGDLRDFNARPFRGVVDVLAAGLPCQPYSVAGKQQGNSDQRSHGEDGSGPIPQFLRIVAECRPALVFLENVPPWVRDGWFRPVGEELSRMGYKVEDPLFITAESVGASHKRERVFVLAHGPGERWRKDVASAAGRGSDVNERGEDLADALRSDWQPRAGRERILDVRETVADAERARRKTPRSRRQVNAGSESESGCGDDVGHASSERTNALAAGSRPRDSVGESSVHMADASGTRLQERQGEPRDDRQERQAVERDGVGLFAPGPGDFDGWGRVVADGSFDYRAPAIKPGVRVLADGMSLVVDASRADQLRCG